MFNIQRKETTMSSKQVEFYLDPGCPWTWLTSRWLVDVAAQRGDLEIAWRPFSLALLNAGRPVPPQFDTAAMREKRSVSRSPTATLPVHGCRAPQPTNYRVVLSRAAIRRDRCCVVSIKR